MKPRSVRDLVGSEGEGDEGADRPRPTPARSGAPPPVRAPGGDDPARPTPVREAMEAERDRPDPVEPPSVTIEVGGAEWLVRTEGRTVTGLPTDPGAPLLFLTFARASEPERRVKETVTVGRRLDDVTHDALAALLERARPYQGEWEESDLFPETRKGRQSRR